MSLQHTAEYIFTESFIFTEGSIFITHSMNQHYSVVKIYKCPNVLIKTLPFHSCFSAQDLCVSINSTKKSIQIISETTREEYEENIEDLYAFEESGADGAVSVRNGAFSENKCIPTLYINGQKIFSIEEPGIKHFYHSTNEMKLYVYIPERLSIKEYLLFNIEQVYPKGLCFLYPEHMTVYLPTEKYTLPIEYTPTSLISLYDHRDVLHHVFSNNHLITYRNQFKRYPDGFRPTKLWNKYHYIYVFSSEDKKLLVLNRDLEIAYEISASSVFVTDEHVFISRKGNTVAHHTKNFSFAFLLSDFTVSDETAAMEMVGNAVLVFVLEKVLKQSTPLFSLFLIEIDIATKKIKKRTPVLCENNTNTEAQVYSLTTDIDKPYVTTGVFSIHTVKKKGKYMAFGICSSKICVFTADSMVLLSTASIQTPFSSTDHTQKRPFLGAPVRIDPDNGVVYIVRDSLARECIFPSLILLLVANRISASLVFELFSDVPEYKTSVQKTLFHFLHTEEIESAIDLIDFIRKYAVHTYEEIISTMLRLLDEYNREKLYSIIDRSVIKSFKCAKSLSKALVQDFSLFEKFLKSAVQQKKEGLLIEFLEFVSKLDDSDLHHKILILLLENRMLYAAGFLLSQINYEKTDSESNINSLPLAQTYRKISHIMDHIKETKQPAETVESVFAGSNPLLVAMLAEKLSIEAEEP